MTGRIEVAEHTSVVRGIPLSEEPGIGALTLGGFLREVTDRFGPREAACISLPEGVERWSYNELWERSVAVAQALTACGVSKGTQVGILMTNRLEFLSAVFGTALAGGVATPFSTFSTPPELEILLQSSGCAVLLLERRVLRKDFAETLAQLEPQIASAAPGALCSLKFPLLRYLAVVDTAECSGAMESWDSFLARGSAVSRQLIEAAAACVSPSDPGVLFFSSGSTGRPKGILSAHRGVCLQLWRWRKWLALQDDVRSWSANGFFWSGNFAMAIGGTLSSGGALVLQRTFDPEEALELMDAERATALFAWPHQWPQLVGARNWDRVDLSSLRYIDANSPIVRHPTVSSDWTEPRHGYGNTETFTTSSIFPANTPPDVAGGSNGEPVPGNTFKIVDPLSGATIPLGERGEIAVKGPTLMLGYIGLPLDETLDAEGFFPTGDAGYFDGQGRLYWEGRLSNIIKTGGANVSPIEVDEVISACPGVKLSQTLGIPDDLLGELVVSCIVSLESAGLSEDGVRGFAKEKLASYKVPRRVLFFKDDELRLTGSSKIKVDELRELAIKRMSHRKRS